MQLESFSSFNISRQLCPLPEGRLVVQLLCPFKFEWSLVQRRTLPQPLPRWSLLGRVQRRSLFTEESGHDDPSKPKYLPLSIQGTLTVLYLALNKKHYSSKIHAIFVLLLVKWRGTRPSQRTKTKIISKHQADKLVAPDRSKNLCTLCNVNELSVSFSLHTHCSGVVLNTLSLIKQKHAYLIWERKTINLIWDERTK